MDSIISSVQQTYSKTSNVDTKKPSILQSYTLEVNEKERGNENPLEKIQTPSNKILLLLLLILLKKIWLKVSGLKIASFFFGRF